MKDLINRLTNAKRDNLSIGDCWNLMDEAADALERLTSGDVELPEPAMKELNPYLGGGSDPYDGATHLQWFTESQLRDYGDRRAAAAIDTRVKIKVGDVYGDDLAGNWYFLQPSDEHAAKALDKHSGIGKGEGV